MILRRHGRRTLVYLSRVAAVTAVTREGDREMARVCADENGHDTAVITMFINQVYSLVKQRETQAGQVHEYQEFPPVANVPEQNPDYRLADWIEPTEDRTREYSVLTTDQSETF